MGITILVGLASLDCFTHLHIRELELTSKILHELPLGIPSVLNMTIHFSWPNFSFIGRTLSVIDLSRTRTLSFVVSPHVSKRFHEGLLPVRRADLFPAPALIKLVIQGLLFYGHPFQAARGVLRILSTPLLKEILFLEAGDNKEAWLHFKLPDPLAGPTLAYRTASAQMIIGLITVPWVESPMATNFWFADPGVVIDSMIIVITNHSNGRGLMHAIRTLDFFRLGLEVGWYGKELRNQVPRLFLGLKTLQFKFEIGISDTRKKEISSLLSSLADTRSALGIPFDSVSAVDVDGNGMIMRKNTP
jgi:hypothetical protein